MVIITRVLEIANLNQLAPPPKTRKLLTGLGPPIPEPNKSGSQANEYREEGQAFHSQVPPIGTNWLGQVETAAHL